MAFQLRPQLFPIKLEIPGKYRALRGSNVQDHALMAGNQGRVQQNKASTGLWQRAGLIMLFAIMTGAGVGAYAGYARLVRSPGGESLAHVRRASLPPSLWVRAAHPVTDDHAPDEIGTWFAKAEDLAAVAAMIVFSDVANSVASAL